MERNEIVNRVKGLQTVKDFARLLNDIKIGEFDTFKHPITEKLLKYLSDSSIASKRYKTFFIPKKNGTKREINAPNYELGLILYLINIVFKSVYTPNEAAKGFAEGRSIVDNAQMHVGHHYVLNIDLKNFFPSIPQARVWKRLQLPPFNLPQPIANVVAGLCCATNAEKTANVLPQGAATSPLLTNAVCDTLDRRLSGASRRFGVHYSRYADDMTFSSMHNVFRVDGEFMSEVRRIIDQQGFTLNERKTRLQCSDCRQEVTGLIVNRQVNVTRRYVRQLRMQLHLWESKGYAKAYAIFYRHYKQEKGYIKKGEPVMENVIEGRLNFLRMVKGENNATYLKLQSRFNKLQQMLFADTETDRGENYIYVQPYTLHDFKECFATEVSLTVSTRKNLVARCVINGRDKTIAISKSTQSALCPTLASMSAGDTVHSDLLSKCFVTLCRKKGKNFWLLTQFEPQRSKCLSVQNIDINVDALLKIWEDDGITAAATAFHQAVYHGEPIVATDKTITPHHQSTPSDKDTVKPRATHPLNVDELPEDIMELLNAPELSTPTGDTTVTQSL